MRGVSTVLLAAAYPRSYRCFLRVKWSQVQILSARHKFWQVKAVSESSGVGAGRLPVFLADLVNDG